MKGRPTSQTQLLSVHLVADRTAAIHVGAQLNSGGKSGRNSKGNVSSIIITYDGSWLHAFVTRSCVAGVAGHGQPVGRVQLHHG